MKKKKEKLLKFFGEKFNKIEIKEKEKDNEIKNEKEEEKENIIKDEKENINEVKEVKIDEDNKSLKNKIPHPHSNTGSVSYPTFMKRGVGNFHINTPKPKKNVKSKEDEKEKENEIEKNAQQNEINNNKSEDKSSEIPSEQKDKLTISLRQFLEDKPI